MVEQWWQ